MKMNYVAPKKMQVFGASCLTAAGVPPKSAQLIAEALITTSLRGVDSHGIRLLPHYIRSMQTGAINPKPVFTFIRSMPSTGILNADHGLGVVAGMEAMRRAVAMARKTGMAGVSVSHSSHFAAAGIYTGWAARQGMIAFACTHVEALVMPYNGRKPFLGTNAISWAVPCAGEDPIVLDMATTTMSYNKMLMYKNSGTKIPAGLATDKHGNPTTNPKTAEYLTHFGGYKGYGIAFMVEVFSSMLSGMNWGPHISPMYPMTPAHRNLGHFFYAINIEAFQKPGVFKHRMHLMAEEIRHMRHISKEHVMVPGDPEKRMYKKRMGEGKIPIPEADFVVLCTVAEKLGIDPKKYLG